MLSCLLRLKSTCHSGAQSFAPTMEEGTIVLYPSPGIGHVVSTVELGKLILLRHRRENDHSFTITIILTTGLLDSPSIASYIQTISDLYPSITFLRLPPISLPPPSATKISGSAVLFDFIRRNDPQFEAALRQVNESRRILACILDLFAASALPFARQLNIPTYYFFTSGAAMLGFCIYLPTLHHKLAAGPTAEISFREMTDQFLDVPGVPPFPGCDVPEPLLDRSDPAYEGLLYFCETLPRSDGIIVNTFVDLEPNAIEIIENGDCYPGGVTPPIYCIGPLIADPNEQGSTKGKEGRDGCLSWLDTQPSKSVVFLCFGSRGTFPLNQLKEIANGLETSGQRFLWVVKRPPVEENSLQTFSALDGDEFDINALLPERFLERTKDRGMVVKSWAPQVEVLSHDSVGGFVTHCGWNSVLEAVVAGVPMVAWPLYAEQYTNKAIMVESMKMAIAVEEEGRADRVVTSAALEKTLRRLMESEQGRELGERSRKMKDMAVAALAEFGSSTIALGRLLDDWLQR